MYDQLSTLPVELIHKILDYVPTFDILTSVWLINKRLRTVSLAYPRFRLELTCSFDKKKIFYQLCTQLVNISSQVVSLALYDLEDETIPDKISYFFGRSNTFNSTFSHLQSLHLSHVNYNVWDSIKTQLVSLVALTATSTNYGIYEEPQTPSFASIILMDLFNFSPSLKRLSLATIDYPYPIATIDPSRTLTASSLDLTFCQNMDIRKPLDLYSFQSNFWLVEKKWYVTHDYCIDTNYALLYSNPYILDSYPFYDMKGTLVTESTDPDPTSFPFVNEFYIPDSKSLNTTLLRRCTHVCYLSATTVDLNQNFRCRFTTMYLNSTIITSLCIDNMQEETLVDVTVQLMHTLPSLRSLRASVMILKLLLA
ncbi:unnamed protein product, partial [Rotaria socialis]